MDRRRIIFGIVLIIILLLVGWLAYQVLGADAADTQSDGFRQWLWSERRFDLLLQMALIFAGALSIAAILPVKEKDNDDAGGNND